MFASLKYYMHKLLPFKPCEAICSTSSSLQLVPWDIVAFAAQGSQGTSQPRPTPA